MTAEPGKWREAVKFAVREVRRLGMFGLTQRELERFSSALLTDARQLAAQGNKISNGGWVGWLGGWRRETGYWIVFLCFVSFGARSLGGTWLVCFEWARLDLGLGLIWFDVIRFERGVVVVVRVV